MKERQVEIVEEIEAARQTSKHTPAALRERIVAHVAARRAGGERIGAVLRNLGINEKTFYHWQGGRSRQPRASFLPVRVRSETAVQPAAELVLELGGGVQVRRVSVQQLAQLVAALR